MQEQSPNSGLCPHNLKPFWSMKRGFKQQAERTALQYRRALQLQAHDPMPANLLAQHLDIPIWTPYDVPGLTDENLQQLCKPGKSCWHAVTIALQPGYLILHNPTNSTVRQESDLMHELAHIICKHESSDFSTKFGLPTRTYNKAQEEEANW